MTRARDVLRMKEGDLEHYAPETQLGGISLTSKRTTVHGIYIISLQKTWEELFQVIDDIVAIEDSTDVNVLASKNTGQGAMLKFVAVTRATRVIDRFTLEPSGARLPVIPDLRANRQLPTEASSINLPTIIALCNRLSWELPLQRHGVEPHESSFSPLVPAAAPCGKFCACAAPFPVSTRGVHA